MLTINAKNSANTTASQIPFTPKITGSKNIIDIWNTIVLKNEITAEITPLFNAVNNDEVNILNPLIIYVIENNLMALAVISTNSAS